MSAKYYKRGVREYYCVSPGNRVNPGRVIRIINKAHSSEVTIAFGVDSSYFLETDALEGTEISREEFAKEFDVASRLIVLEP